MQGLVARLLTERRTSGGGIHLLSFDSSRPTVTLGGKKDDCPHRLFLRVLTLSNSILAFKGVVNGDSPVFITKFACSPHNFQKLLWFSF